MKSILFALALVVSAQAFANNGFMFVEDSKIQFAPVRQGGLEAKPWEILTKPIKIEGRVFIGTDVGLYQVVQTKTGRQATPAFTDCRVLADYKMLDCQPVEELSASSELATHARVLLGENYMQYDLYLGRLYSVVGTRAKVYYGSM